MYFFNIVFMCVIFSSVCFYKYVLSLDLIYWDLSTLGNQGDSVLHVLKG